MARPAPRPAPARRRRLVLAFKLLASALLVAWVVSFADLGQVAETLKSADPAWLLVVVGLQVIGPWITAIRWRGLLAAQGHPLPLGYLYGSCIVAGFVRLFLPSTIGGDAIRAHDAWRAGLPTATAVASVALDRLVGLVGVALMALPALWLAADIRARLPALDLLVLLASAALLALLAAFVLPLGPARLRGEIMQRLPRRLMGPVRKIAEIAAPFRDRPRVIATALLWSLLLQLNVILFYFAIGRALGLPPGLAAYLVVVPVAVVVMMLPISINGIGVREGIFSLLLGAYGVGVDGALAFAWAELAVVLAFGLIGGVVYLLRGQPLPVAQGER